MNDKETAVQQRRPHHYLIVAITVILTGWALKATGSFMIPVIFSIILALLVAPLDRWVTERVPEKLGWLGHLAAMGTILVVLLAFAGLMWIAAQQTIDRFPDPTGNDTLLPEFDAGASEEQDDGSGSGEASGSDSASEEDVVEMVSPDDDEGGTMRELYDQFEEYLTGAGISLIERLADWGSSFATGIMSAVGATLGATVLIVFLTLIMLIEAPTWRGKIVSILTKSSQDKAAASIDIIADRLRRYLLARTILGVMTAVLYGGWLWIFGVDLLVVWVLITFLLNFIPTFGSLVSGVLPVIYAFTQKDFGTGMAIGAGILVIEQVMGNYVDPRVQGRQVSVSSLVILVNLLVWSWVWGVAGAILATPITIAAMIICAHIPSMRSFALLLSDACDYEGLDRQAKNLN